MFTSQDWIAMKFDGNTEGMHVIIRMDGSCGLRKSIKGLSGVSTIEICHVNLEQKTCISIGTLNLPQNISEVNLVIDFDTLSTQGNISICNTDEVWSYSLDEDTGYSQTDVCKTSIMGVDARDVVDKEKVRQLEEENNKSIVWPDELTAELKKNIYGQDEAIQKVSEIISANLRRKQSEVETIVLFGPTGVGKTELGKELPGALERLSGQNYGFQQISLNEFIGEHSVNRFFGSPPSYVGYKDPTIFEPVRSNPYQIFLLDEIEKATDRIYTGLMECFSNGKVHLADNSPDIDLSHVIFIITSNIPIDMVEYKKASAFRKKELCRDTLAKACGHPEIAGKITNCLAFQELPADALTDIVSKFVIDELANYDMKLEHMDEKLMVQLKRQHSNYGARGVKDAVREAITSATVYDRNIDKYSGKNVILSGNIENIMITIV